MQLESDRLLYDKFTENDFEDFFSWYGDNKVMKKVTGKALSKIQALARFEMALAMNDERAHAGLYSVKLKAKNKFMGIVKFSYLSENEVEVGYGSLPKYWGKGYAKEMLKCLMDHAKSYSEIKTLVGIVNANNKVSMKILEKHNFRLIIEDIDKMKKERRFEYDMSLGASKYLSAFYKVNCSNFLILPLTILL